MLVSGQAAETNSVNGGENSKNCSSRDSSSSHNLQSSFPITLKFADVSYKLKLQDQGSTKSRTRSIRGMFGGGVPTPSSDVENPTAVIHHHHQERTILNGITGVAAPEKILAILGPSGSGKSTLLNALGGRLHHGHGLTGTILFNNRKLSKSVMKNSISPEIGIHGLPVDNLSRSGSGGVNLCRLSGGVDLSEPATSNWSSKTSVKFEVCLI